MKIRKVLIPQDSLINQYLPSHYSDAFEGDVMTQTAITPDDMQIAFWTTKPAWINRLFKLRNTLVKPFQLKLNTVDYEKNIVECLTTGKPYTLISIAAKSKDETVLCTKDKHLTFYLSVKIKENTAENKTITVSTRIHFHNLFGRCYFMVIYPFHLMVVSAMLKASICHIHNNEFERKKAR